MDLRTSGEVVAGAAKDPHLLARALVVEETNAIREGLAGQAARATLDIPARETNQALVLGSLKEAALEGQEEVQISGQMGTMQPMGVKWHKAPKL